MRISFGPFTLAIRYTYQRGSTTIYQRAVPTDLRGRYPGKTIKRDLKTQDPVKVARLVAGLNKSYEAEWAALRQSPGASPASLKVHVREFLRGFRLAPHAVPDGTADPDAVELLSVALDAKCPSYSVRPGEDDREPSPVEYLSPVELAAWQALHSPRRDTLSDLRDVFISTHRKRNSPRFVKDTGIAFDALIAAVGDKAVEAFSRADAHAFVDARLDAGNKTTTVRRRINTLNAAWNAYRMERSISVVNYWVKLPIADEGRDAVPRVPYTAEELARLYAACRAADDDRRWLLAMVIDTGARPGEIAGLLLRDIRLDAPVPHIVIQVHAWRDVKDADNARRSGNRRPPHSARSVPLVGASLWAAGRVVGAARADARFAFPRYCKELPDGSVRCGAGSASATVNKWIRSQGMAGKVAYELRHSIIDRLRAVQCPRDISHSITGHTSQDVGDSYGVGYSLEVKREWLLKVALSAP